jgi:ferredoxin
VDAIVADSDATVDIKFWLDINTRLSKKWPVITKQKPALPDADNWKDVPDKIKLLEE